TCCASGSWGCSPPPARTCVGTPWVLSEKIGGEQRAASRRRPGAGISRTPVSGASGWRAFAAAEFSGRDSGESRSRGCQAGGGAGSCTIFGIFRHALETDPQGDAAPGLIVVAGGRH